MLVYVDIVTGKEICTDSHPYETVADGTMFAVKTKMTTIGGEQFDTGANASAEEANESYDDEKVQVINIVHAHELQEVEGCDKNLVKAAYKGYFAALKAQLKYDDMNEDEKKEFDTALKSIQGWIVGTLFPKFDEFRFYMSKEVDVGAGMIIPGQYVGADTTPTLHYIIKGLKMNKF